LSVGGPKPARMGILNGLFAKIKGYSAVRENGMETIKTVLEVPLDLFEALDVSRARMEERLRELIVVELFREGRVSSGKGARILGMSKRAFIELLGRRGVPCFTESPEELEADVKVAESLLKAKSA